MAGAQPTPIPENKQRLVRIARSVPLGVYAGYSHCGKKMGIMGSVAPQSAAPQVSYADIVLPNQTTYVDITLKRQVDKNVFRFDPADQPRGSFKKVQSTGELIDD